MSNGFQDPVALAAQRLQQQRSTVTERDRLLAEVHQRVTLRQQRELAETLAYVKSYVEWLRRHKVRPKKIGMLRRSAWPVAAEGSSPSVHYVTKDLRFCDKRGRHQKGYVPDMGKIAPGVATYLADIGLADLWRQEH